MADQIAIFDAYGTLFDINAPARAFAAQIGGPFSADWPLVADIWRQKQLSYSWLRQITNRYQDFWQLTQDALDFALHSTGHDNDATIRAGLLALYQKLDAYAEVDAVLNALHSRKVTCAILSNGTPQMLADAIAHAGLSDRFDSVLSVADIGIYKPDARAYHMVLDRYNVAPHHVRFISSNGWDIAGAGLFGFETYWINRAGAPIDRLDYQPNHISADLTDLPGKIA